MEDWKYPYEVKKLRLADTIQVAYIDEGQGDQTLLFIHGLGSYLKAWQKNIDDLAKSYRCIAIDLPGYGKSSKENYPYDMSFFAKVVIQLSKQLALENIVLVGHSMGGQIAIHATLKTPSLFDRLVLIAPAGFELFSDQEKQWFKTFYTSAFIKAATEEQIIKNFQINFYDMPQDAQFMIEDRLYMRQTKEYDRYCEMVPQCVQGMLQEPVYDQLKQIKLATLILYGQEDQLIPNKLLHPTLSTETIAKQGAETISNSQLKIIAQAGHFLNWEQSGQVNQEIRDFLKK